ncbi:DUF1963 domain-containing protein [Spirosoma aerolatum]|uniref:DUF1963 domain-containing protein n=1 Tax=Spirosoma aerolatum TaxID=1211326 RepID=UPI0009AE3562|nr:DUF1963 domain-containing protein [Spirosoma aerolatum]
MTQKAFREAIGQKAIRLKVGGFRPVDKPQASWFGKVLLAGVDEQWPMSNGKPMRAICQINLQEFPVKPESVQDLAFITLFIDADEIPNPTDKNGMSWCLRTYPSLDELVPLTQANATSGPGIKPLQMIPEVIEIDYPMLEDCPVPIPSWLNDDEYPERYRTVDGIKFGGWPTLIQGEIVWEANAQMQPQFAFQIDSVEKARWWWGDNGVAYFGRCLENTDEWSFSWQCF